MAKFIKLHRKGIELWVNWDLIRSFGPLILGNLASGAWLNNGVDSDFEVDESPEEIIVLSNLPYLEA